VRLIVLKKNGETTGRRGKSEGTTKKHFDPGEYIREKKAGLFKKKFSFSNFLSK
jgi:hypothetical protein